jgi:hypothetical protein
MAQRRTFNMIEREAYPYRQLATRGLFRFVQRWWDWHPSRSPRCWRWCLLASTSRELSVENDEERRRTDVETGHGRHRWVLPVNWAYWVFLHMQGDDVRTPSSPTWSLIGFIRDTSTQRFFETLTSLVSILPLHNLVQNPIVLTSIRPVDQVFDKN